MTFNELLELDKQAASRPRERPKPRATQRKPRADPEAKPMKQGVPAQRDRGTTVSRQRDASPRSMIERMRGSVIKIGKEAATHRFTREEKDALADAVYTYGRQGYRTSENEIVRIGVNWLMGDYKEHGNHSVLHRVLRALKE